MKRGIMSEKLSDRIVQWSYNEGTVERGGIVTRTIESLEFSNPKFPQKAE